MHNELTKIYDPLVPTDQLNADYSFVQLSINLTRNAPICEYELLLMQRTFQIALNNSDFEVLFQVFAFSLERYLKYLSEFKYLKSEALPLKTVLEQHLRQFLINSGVMISKFQARYIAKDASEEEPSEPLFDAKASHKVREKLSLPMADEMVVEGKIIQLYKIADSLLALIPQAKNEKLALHWLSLRIKTLLFQALQFEIQATESP